MLNGAINLNHYDEAQRKRGEGATPGVARRGGEEIVITKSDGASYKITVTALETQKPARRIAGLGKGNIAFMSDDFDDELP